MLTVERYLLPSKTKSGGASQPRSAPGTVSLWMRRIVTFNILCVSLAFFRATSLRGAVDFLSGLSNFTWRPEYLAAFLMLGLFTLPLLFVDLLQEAGKFEYPFANAPYAIRAGIAVAGFIVLALFSGSNLNAFVYFRF